MGLIRSGVSKVGDTGYRAGKDIGRRIHDIILGDFGRSGTLRYLTLFSDHERDILIGRCHAFYDEYRAVRYTVVGVIDAIKAPWLRKFSDASRALDDSILAGVSDGIAIGDLAAPIAAALAPYVDQAIRGGAQRVRVIVPCNTLSPVLRQIKSLLQTQIEQCHEHAGACVVEIEVPSIPELVVPRLGSAVHASYAFLGTASAFAEYQSVIVRNAAPVTLFRYGDGSDRDLSMALLHQALGGSVSATEARPTPAAGVGLLCGCTDFCVTGATDALEIFARAVAEDAYGVVSP
jgi:hypothetical protein